MNKLARHFLVAGKKCRAQDNENLPDMRANEVNSLKSRANFRIEELKN